MRSIAQDVVVLNGGTIVEAGPVDEVLGNPSDPYTVSLMNDIPKA